MRSICAFQAVGLVLAASAPAAADSFTVATFADPAPDSSTPLFTVDLTANRITGGWDDLELFVTGIPFPSASFTLTDPAGGPGVEYLDGDFNGVTGPGVIRFFEDGADPQDEPLVRIDFDSAQLAPSGVAADTIFSSNNVTMTGTAVSGVLTDGAFTFAFANQEMLPNDDGFQATASFTSSAVPEPSVVVLLALGLTTMVGRRRAFFSGGRE